MKNKNVIFDPFRLTWTISKEDGSPTFDIVDLDNNPCKIKGSFTFNCDCPTFQLMIRGCNCGGI